MKELAIYSQVENNYNMKGNKEINMARKIYKSDET